MTPTRVLFLDHAPALGGAEYSLLDVLARLPRERVTPLLLCASGPVAEEARRRGIPYQTMTFPRLRGSPTFPLDGWRIARDIARQARAFRAHLLYTNTVRAQVYSVAAHLLTRIPLVWHMRDFWLSETRPRHPLLDRWGKRAICAVTQQVIANSRAVAEHLPCASKTVVVYNGIEVEQFHPGEGRAAFRREHRIPADVPVVGMVGRLRTWKGQDRFLRGAKHVVEQFPTARFLLVGGTPFGDGGNYEQYLRTLVRTLGLGERVVFTGHMPDVRPALAAMDIFVHSGDPEPFGRVVIEAMAMERPVVAFAHGALPEIVIPHQTGLLVEPYNEEALARAIIALLENKAARERMGRRARERVARAFHIRLTVERLTDILNPNPSARESASYF